MHSIEFVAKCKIFLGVVLLICLTVQFYFHDLPTIPAMPVECNCRKPNKIPFIDPLKGLEDSSKKLVDDDKNGENDDKKSITHEKENDIENNEQENLPSTLYYVEEDHNEYEVLEEEEENPLLEKSFNEYKFDLSNLVQSLITKMLLIQIKNDLHDLRDWERESLNNSKLLVDHVRSTIDNFNSNFQSKLAYLMYLKEIIWRDCKIENFILSSQKEYDNHLDYQESNTMLVEKNAYKNMRNSKNLIMNFNVRLNLFNDLLIGCNIVDFAIK